MPEFMKLCRPDRSDETFRKAIHIASTGGDCGSDNVLYWAIQRFGVFELKQATGSDRVRSLWRTIYNQRLSEHRAGTLPPIPQQLKALPGPGGARTFSSEDIRVMIDKAMNKAAA